MNCCSIFYFFAFLLLSCQTVIGTVKAGNDGVYIVYMGAAPSSTSLRRNDIDLILSSLPKRKNRVFHIYSKGFLGFAARLSKEEAQSIAQTPGVVSVFPDPVLKLHTTRSWDFLKYQSDLEINFSPNSRSTSHGEDTIVGFLDTGIWPESKSFSDKDFSPVPSKWKGTCMDGPDFTCNRKLIGARYYDDDPKPLSSTSSSPRDHDGHGTHVAATAAGRLVEGASYLGMAEGIARGGSPGSRIAVYRVCSVHGCPGSAILKAFDDAISDGVDILSISLGSSADTSPELSEDPIAIGAFHAVEKGILVVCSAGNDGPDGQTVVNTAPWILTVAATTIDRHFESDVILGGNKVIEGGGINFGNIQKSPVYPLIYGLSAKNFEAIDEAGRMCAPGALDDNKVKGNILVCEDLDVDVPASVKLNTIIDRQGGIGVISIDDDSITVESVYGSYPVATVTSNDGSEILSFINSTRNPLATILPTVEIKKYKPAPSVAYFSARGPAFAMQNILKPDIAAPGVDILAAWPSNEAKTGETTPPFKMLSGTSMSCPHVTGVAATVKSRYPSWGPSAIRSAIMTTAIQTDNLKSPITTNYGEPATGYDFGAGEVSVTGPLQPGLVYETETSEYLLFLCNVYGYDTSLIKQITQDLPDKFSCPSNLTPDAISNMNYPSISVSNFKENERKKVTRTVTNVGENEELYTAIIDAPTGLEIQVTPSKLQFTKHIKKLRYEVNIRLTKPLKDGELWGSISWTNGKYNVRSTLVASTGDWP